MNCCGEKLSGAKHIYACVCVCVNARLHMHIFNKIQIQAVGIQYSTMQVNCQFYTSILSSNLATLFCLKMAMKRTRDIYSNVKYVFIYYLLMTAVRLVFYVQETFSILGYCQVKYIKSYSSQQLFRLGLSVFLLLVEVSLLIICLWQCGKSTT